MAHVPIPAGSLGITRPIEPLPEGWTMYTHPEGKPYYHRDAREPEPTLLLGVSALLAVRCPRLLTTTIDKSVRQRQGSLQTT